jgi:hypothetical protein
MKLGVDSTAYFFSASMRRSISLLASASFDMQALNCSSPTPASLPVWASALAGSAARAHLSWLLNSTSRKPKYRSGLEQRASMPAWSAARSNGKSRNTSLALPVSM